MKRESSRRYYLEHLAVMLVVAGLCVALLQSGAWMSLSRYFYDHMLGLLPPAQTSGMTLVTIDDISLQEMGRWPWDRSVHAQLVQRLDALGARVIVLDLMFAEPDRTRPETDAALVAAMVNHGAVLLPVQVSGQPAPRELPPHAAFARAAAGMGHVSVEMDEDGLVRGFYLRAGIGQAWWPHLSLAVLNTLQPGAQRAWPPLGASEDLGIQQQYFRLIPFREQEQDFRRVSVLDVLHGEAAVEEAIRGQIVFVGATAQGLGDVVPIPVGGRRSLMPGVELNATVFAALRDQRLLRSLPQAWIWGLSLALALITPTILPFVSPRWSIPVVVLSLLGILLFSYTLLYWQRLWFPVGPAMIGALLAYPLWTWRRLEYSLGYMRQALRRLSVHDDLNRRILEQARLERFLDWLDRVLPVTAWRLTPAQPGTPALPVSSGGEAVAERSWQGARGRHYNMSYQGRDYELSLIWDEGCPTPAHEQWIWAMIARCEERVTHHDGYYDVVESHIERVRAQENRQQALTRFFEATLEQLRDGIVISDACGDLLYANPQASEWLGLRYRELDEITLMELGRELVIEDRRDWSSIVLEAIGEGRSQLECRSNRGLDLYLDVLRIRVGQQPGEVLIVTLRDISDVKQAMRTRSETMDFLSHDLRSPMVSVLALVERARSTPMPQDQLLAHTEHYARRSLNIAEQFLQLTRAEALQQEDFQLVDMLAAAEAALEQVAMQAQSREIQIRFEYEPGEEVWVTGSLELLERGLINLLTNAIKYSHEGGAVQVRLYCQEERVCCAVEDEGVGIEEAFLSQLFKPFSRAASSGGARTRGAGLGLRFVKVVAERHGGDVTVTSRLGQGSCFTLMVPRTRVD